MLEELKSRRNGDVEVDLKVVENIGEKNTKEGDPML